MNTLIIMIVILPEKEKNSTPVSKCVPVTKLFYHACPPAHQICAPMIMKNRKVYTNVKGSSWNYQCLNLYL